MHEEDAVIASTIVHTNEPDQTGSHSTRKAMDTFCDEEDVVIASTVIHADEPDQIGSHSTRQVMDKPSSSSQSVSITCPVE